MMDLKNILAYLKIERYCGSSEREIRSVCFDSTQTGENDLFVALKGTKSDGHDFIDLAIKQGASVIVCEKMPEKINQNICYVQVNDSHEALGKIASAYYGHPSTHLKLIGVTGTNGKTTVATLLYKMFRSFGYRTGLISTIEVINNEKSGPASHTTPDSVQLNQLLAEMLTEGCEYVFMEVSSHAAHQKRIAGLSFTGGIFTNLTHDHLDYHHSFRDYLEAKKIFFNNLPSEAFALINADDKNGMVMVQNTKAKIFTYGIKKLTDFRGKISETHLEGNLMHIGKSEIWTQLPGRFNAYNILAVYGTSILSGIPKDKVLKVISEQVSVSGRFEIIRSERGITGIVDYAHTPDALKNVLLTINELKKKGCSIITIVGAGGNRDKTKRPIMAKIAAEMSTRLILTSDNPRDENPEVIISEMKNGLDDTLMKKTISITEREEAIKTACALAVREDIILLSGKGHETYQEIKGIKYHFDDRELLKKYL